MDKKSTFYHFLPLITIFYAHIIHRMRKIIIQSDFQKLDKVGSIRKKEGIMVMGLKKNTFAATGKN